MIKDLRGLIREDTMNFQYPQLLVGLLLVPLSALFLLWAAKRQKRDLARLGDKSLIRRLSANINWRGRRWQRALRLVALALFIFALARPQWGREVREIEQEGLQVMVALDVSQSMLADDIKPTRLDRAKLEIADLMERLDGDEVGLVLFSGASFHSSAADLRLPDSFELYGQRRTQIYLAAGNRDWRCHPHGDDGL